MFKIITMKAYLNQDNVTPHPVPTQHYFVQVKKNLQPKISLMFFSISNLLKMEYFEGRGDCMSIMVFFYIRS